MRNNWIHFLEKIVFPVLSATSEDVLKLKMPIYKDRRDFQYLEAVGRIMCGIGPWLNLPSDESDESIIREKYKKLTLNAIANLVNPKAKDYVNFGNGSQALVDSAYLAQGFLRAPNLWHALEPQVKKQVIFELKKTRSITPPKNNWLLFSSMVEVFLLEYNKEYNRKRLYNGVEKFINNFYFGDGIYGDGPSLSIDHYNSYVIHPMLMDILNVMLIHKLKKAAQLYDKQVLRYKRYIQIQERMISPEGAYPLFGRTLICRFGAFHALAQAPLINLIPKEISGGQIRCALNAVLKKQMASNTNFDSKGFLTVGFNGEQEKMQESYVSSGSPYHCATIFLPLGVPKEHSFWISENQKWTALKAYIGEEFEADHMYYEKNKFNVGHLLSVYSIKYYLYKIAKYLKVR